MVKFLLDLMNLTRSAGPWLGRVWYLVSAAIGFSLATAILQLGFIVGQGTSVELWWKLGLYVGLPICAVASWLGATQLYLRTGKGTRIGVAYEGYKVDLSDWAYTRDALKELMANGQLCNAVSLRFVPQYAWRGGKPEEFMRKYGFTMLCRIHESPKVGKAAMDTPDKNAIGMEVVSTHKPDPNLEKMILKTAPEIVRQQTAGVATNMRQLLEKKVVGLHSMMMLLAACINFVRGHDDDASVICRYIDDRLEARKVPHDKSPRFEIRQLDVDCCVRRLNISMKDVPQRHDLEARLQYAESRSMRYFGEFTLVYLALSRGYFLLGDVKRAVELTGEIETEMERLQGMGRSLNPDAVSRVAINRAFLSFIQGHWHHASVAFERAFSTGTWGDEDRAGIIDFADYVKGLDTYEGVSYLQVLYRILGHKDVPSDIKNEADEWLAEDKSRACLQALLTKHRRSLKVGQVAGGKRNRRRGR